MDSVENSFGTDFQLITRQKWAENQKNQLKFYHNPYYSTNLLTDFLWKNPPENRVKNNTILIETAVGFYCAVSETVNFE